MHTPALTVTVTDDEAVVALVGEHEAYSAEKLARCLSGLIDEAVPITVDLGRAAFIDSTVVGELLAASHRARSTCLPFRLRLGAETGWPVRRLLEVTGLDTQFDVVSA